MKKVEIIIFILFTALSLTLAYIILDEKHKTAVFALAGIAFVFFLVLRQEHPKDKMKAKIAKIRHNIAERKRKEKGSGIM